MQMTSEITQKAFYEKSFFTKHKINLVKDFKNNKKKCQNSNIHAKRKIYRSKLKCKSIIKNEDKRHG